MSDKSKKNNSEKKNKLTLGKILGRIHHLFRSMLKVILSFILKLTKKDRKDKKKDKKKNKKESLLLNIIHFFLSLIWKIITFPFTTIVGRTLFVIFIATITYLTIYLIKELPSPQKLKKNQRYAVSSQIFDRNGTLLYELFSDVNRIPIKLKDLPEHVYQASIAIEDKNFFHHHGLDISGIMRAITRNIKSDELQGGSTITQQLVKNALLTPEKSIKRKIKEAVLAILVEMIYTKEEILEMYLNYISYGGTATGIEAAAKKYFDKSAKELTLGEATLLAGLPQAPSSYSPFGAHPERAKNRQAEVLRRMVEDGYINQEKAEEVKKAKLNYALSKTEIKAPHFVFYVRDYLYEKYGKKKVETSGFRIHTTLDLNTQDMVQKIVAEELKELEKKKVGNGATLITKPNTGEILAMVGSKDYFNSEEDGQVNVTIAQRQPGSSIKPLVYATAIQRKLINPGSMILDIPTCFTQQGNKDYCPRNYTGGFMEAVSIRRALGNSLNIPAVKTIRMTGVYTFIKQAQKMGISTWEDTSRFGLSLSLGGGEVKMVDMAQAFGTLANQGVKVPLTAILKIEDYQGQIIEETNVEKRKENLEYLTNFEHTSKKGELTRVMNRAPAFLVSHILQDNTARYETFSSRSNLVIKDKIVSAKTGTTNEMKDNWTIGYTPETLVITWVGNNDNTRMGYLVSGVTGAAPIFNEIMTELLSDTEAIFPQAPSDVKKGGVCRTGLPPEKSNIRCSVYTTDYYWTKSFPTRSRQTEKEIWVKADTGVPPQYGETADNLVLEKHLIYQDPLTRNYCADCNRASTEEGRTIYERHIVPHDLPLQDFNEEF